MNVQEQIKMHIESLPDSKKTDLFLLHKLILKIMPASKLWFLDGKNAKGKIVSNPNIGYGSQLMKYADGSTKEFYRIGLSAHSTGISVYIMGIQDKKYLSKNFGGDIGKATVTGYCIKFKTLDDINIKVLKAAIQFGSEYEKQSS